MEEAHEAAAAHAEACPQQADALALRCLVLRLMGGAPAEGGVKAEAVGGEAPGPGINGLAAAHLQLLRAAPASEQAMAGGCLARLALDCSVVAAA